MYEIHKLVLRRMLARTLAVFVFVAAITMTTQLLNQAFRLLEASAGLLAAARMFWLFLPSVSVMILPVAFLIALVHTYDGMREGSETTIVLGSGAKPAFLLLPAAGLALALALFVLVLSVAVEPAANRAGRTLQGSLRFDAIRMVANDGVLREIERGLFVRGGPPAPDDTINGIFILDRRASPAETLYVAETARLTRSDGKLQLQMLNGALQVREQPGQESARIAFGEYRSDPEFFFSDTPLPFRAREMGTLALWRAFRTGADTGLAADAVRAELVRRGTDWLYPLVYFCLGGWFVAVSLSGAGPAPRGLRWTLVVAVLTGAAVRIAGFAALGRAGVSVSAAIASFAVPLGAIMLFGVLLGRRVAAAAGNVR